MKLSLIRALSVCIGLGLPATALAEHASTAPSKAGPSAAGSDPTTQEQPKPAAATPAKKPHSRPQAHGPSKAHTGSKAHHASKGHAHSGTTKPVKYERPKAKTPPKS